MSFLNVEDLQVNYGAITAIRNINLQVEQGEIVTLIGANGAGKSTILRTITGLVSPAEGRIVFQGKDFSKVKADQIVSLGITHVPEGRGMFMNLTVMENLELATWTRRKDKVQVKEDYDQVFSLFPRLLERRTQKAATLSGGEQQMLAVARAMMSHGQLMLLDEPSMGLAPILVKEIFHVLRDINRQGTTILLVEQNAHMALKIANRAYILETGNIVMDGDARELESDPRVKKAYMGG
ncbi:High-affinity branched-chain amino acid transport ATP-binding protein LivF [bioreactor metagenome]|uniref:High-affinity branched-chain amino acid transport ATP-binding protein LivF n=1 Tax=bioreactor metagenome TaxID=1076179 RepID=A0A644YLF2_9ZZZZ